MLFDGFSIWLVDKNFDWFTELSLHTADLHEADV
jgi:hypothetical protein